MALHPEFRMLLFTESMSIKSHASIIALLDTETIAVSRRVYIAFFLTLQSLNIKTVFIWLNKHTKEINVKEN